MDLTQCFCWITGIGAIIGLIAAIQQLLLHGWRPFIRAVAVAFVIGWALVLIYPNIRVHTVGGTVQVAVARHPATAEPTPVGQAPLDHAPLNPAAVANPVPMPAEARLAEARPDNAAAPDHGPVYPTTAGPAPAPTPSACRLAEVPPPKPAASAPTTVSTTSKPSAAAPVKPAPAEAAPVAAATAKSAPSDRIPLKLVKAQPGRVEYVGFQPVLPEFLPQQHRLFWPSEVAYCPICSSIYSSQGPIFGVNCPHCDGKVNLVSNSQYMVHRCGKCGSLYRTTYFPSATAPNYFRYFCPVCNEYHWFPN